jgi:hypothetical protein
MDTEPGIPGPNQYESGAHPFIVKVWLEETAEEAGLASWRGHITHVPSGRRQYFQDLDGIAAFVAPYLEQMEVKLGRVPAVGNGHERYEE